MIAWLRKLFLGTPPASDALPPQEDPAIEKMLTNQPVIHKKASKPRKPKGDGEKLQIVAPQYKRRPGRPRKPRHD